MTEELYQDALSADGRNLSRLALDKKISLPVYRERQVASIIESIKNGRSVLLVGEVGIGKTAILHGVAAELPRIARELWELPTIALLTRTRYLGEWQSKTNSVLKNLKERRGILYFTDIWNASR
jgi:ATP-dependent Clp protease ATP-binding subunit ClpA